MLGRVLFNKNNINLNDYKIENISLSDGTLFVKTTLVNGKQKTQKLVLKQ